MRVSEMFLVEKIAMEHLELIREESPYWEDACSFAILNWNRDTNHLTAKQFKWVEKIVEDITEMRIEKTGVFSE